MTGDTPRLLTDFEVPAPAGLATDEVLMGTTALRLYTYEGAALVGRYQDAAANINVDWCREHGLDVNRRLTGGGAILMTPDQLGIALTLNRERYDLPRDNRALFERFGSAVVGALGELGLDARFVPKNDIVVDGQKIAGLGLWDRAGEVQFHCSLLVDMDVETMLKALRIPAEKLSDKHVASAAERITTVAEQTGDDLSTISDAVHEGFEETLDIAFEPGTLTDEERAAVDRLVEERYDTDEWRFRIEADAAEHAAERKTEGGMVRALVATEDDVITRVRLAGDFFARQQTVNEIEAALKWTPMEAEAVREALAEAPSVPDVESDAVAETVLEACEATPAASGGEDA